MGGLNEDTIETKSPVKGTLKAGEEYEITGTRFHLVGGTVHFHDAKDRLIKVEVPISDWIKGWNQLNSPTHLTQDSKATRLVATFTYTNPGRGTLLLCQSDIEISKGKRAGSMSMQVSRVTYDKAWTQLEDFITKGR